MSKTWLTALFSLALATSAAACTTESDNTVLRASPLRLPEPTVSMVKTPDVAPSTRDVLAQHRRQQIERLRAYAQAGAFPHNTTTDAPLHMFRDAQGNYCAVANLIHQDGRDDLVETTVKTRNDLAVADVSDGPVMDWVLASGLTKEEVVRIQEPAPRMRSQPTPEPRAVAPTPVKKIVPVAVVKPAPAAPKGLTEAEMQAKIRAHVAEVLSELEANTAKSLDLAVARREATNPS